MDVPPVLGRGVCRVDSECFHAVDRLKNLLDFRPTGDAEQALAAWTYKRYSRVAFACLYGAQDVDPRHDGAEVVGRPAYKRKDAVCRKRDDAMLSIDDVLLDGAAEADPVLDAPLD